MTAFLQITDMELSQSGKYLTHNQANHRLAVMAQTVVEDRDLTTPPGSPSSGQVYIPKATATGSWAGHEDDLAIYDSGWVFLTPDEGWIVYLQDEDLMIFWDGTYWKPLNLNDLVQSKASGDTVNIDWSFGSTAIVTLDRATTTFSFSGAKNGQRCVLICVQDGTGSRAVAFGAEVRAGTDLSSPPTLSGANLTDYLGYIYNGSDSKYDFVSLAKGF